MKDNMLYMHNQEKSHTIGKKLIGAVISVFLVSFFVFTMGELCPGRFWNVGRFLSPWLDNLTWYERIWYGIIWSR